jgi:hypothetical protein
MTFSVAAGAGHASGISGVRLGCISPTSSQPLKHSFGGIAAEHSMIAIGQAFSARGVFEREAFRKHHCRAVKAWYCRAMKFGVSLRSSPNFTLPLVHKVTLVEESEMIHHQFPRKKTYTIRATVLPSNTPSVRTCVSHHTVGFLWSRSMPSSTPWRCSGFMLTCNL